MSNKNNNKKILFVVTQLYKGGAEVVLINLLNALSKENFDIDLLVHDQAYIPNYISLLEDVPNGVNLCNASENESLLVSYAKKLFKKLYLSLFKKLWSRKKAVKFVSKKDYDIAISYGEWMTPEFIIKEVQAKKKYIWVHNDLNMATYFKKEIFFRNYEEIDKYIFVSDSSLKNSENRYPLLKRKSLVIHNLLAEDEIRSQSKEELTIKFPKADFIFVTIANYRPQKKHDRMLKVAQLLKEKGISFIWICAGGIANKSYYRKLLSMIKEYRLEENIILLDSLKNPYPLLKKATAQIILSDYESWSLAITESKLLRIPVISTRTSGAVEQIEDMVNGILVDWDINQIVEKIIMFCNSPELQNQIKQSLLDYSYSEDILGKLLIFLGENHEEKNLVH